MKKYAPGKMMRELLIILSKEPLHIFQRSGKILKETKMNLKLKKLSLLTLLCDAWEVLNNH